jgi:serine/threonine protein kinase
MRDIAGKVVVSSPIQRPTDSTATTETSDAPVKRADRMLLGESIAMASFHPTHPHILSVYSVETFNERNWMLMPFLTDTVEKWMKREKGRLNLRQVCEIGIQTLDALSAVHRNNYVHCDIKPSNIGLDVSRDSRVSPTFLVKVLDFGLAINLTADERRRGGSSRYADPDSYVNPGKPTPLWDIYSVGCTLQELVKHSERDNDERISHVINKALASPSSRYQTAEEMKLELQRLALDERFSLPSWYQWPRNVAVCYGGWGVGKFRTSWSVSPPARCTDVLPEYEKKYKTVDAEMPRGSGDQLELVGLKKLRVPDPHAPDTEKEIELEFAVTTNRHINIIKKIWAQLDVQSKQRWAVLLQPGWDCWSTVMGTHVTVITTDNKILFTMRSSQAGTNAGMWTCGATAAMLFRPDNGVPTPAKTAALSLKETFNLDIEPSSVTFFGLGVREEDVAWGSSLFDKLSAASL